MAGREYYALFMDLGTGKTFTFLSDAERLYNIGEIDGLLIVAPKGVHTNWVRREIPAHLDCLHVARAWGHDVHSQRALKVLFEVMKPNPLRIFAINIDALKTARGFDIAKRFLLSTHSMMVVDESSRIKNVKTGNWKACMKLKPFTRYRRIGSGLPITRHPPDLFGQMEWLEEGLLETNSYRAFVAEYACLLDDNHPMKKKLIQRNPRAAWAQIIERDKHGQPMFRNLDRLQTLIQPHSYRVLKEHCLDLPPKIYKNVYFQMTPRLQRSYTLMEEKLRYELTDGSVNTVSRLNAILKLQQITSGFIIDSAGVPQLIEEAAAPRLEALLEVDEDMTQPYIVWCHFREEIKQVTKALRERGRNVVEYHGGVKTAEREAAVDLFQNGGADVFVGQPRSGGIGLTLTAAKTVIYYSNSYDLEERKQSEDRAHRAGTTGTHVLYIDLVAQNSIDEVVAKSLQAKLELATTVLDPKRFAYGNGSDESSKRRKESV